MNKQTQNWLKMVNYDLVTAKNMLTTGRYLYVVFMCHLAIEKALKAIISEETNKIPPKTHDLIYLLSKGKLELSSDLVDFVGIMNNVSIVTRYPEDLRRLITSYPKKVAQNYLDITKKVVRCIKKDQRLRES